jgi:ParB-like chromosome segregation protein Spo0J
MPLDTLNARPYVVIRLPVGQRSDYLARPAMGSPLLSARIRGRRTLVQQIVSSAASVVPSPGRVVLVPLPRLMIKPSYREAGVNQDHVERLVALGGRWPPILVHQDNGLVIDGAHRVLAARSLRLDRIAAALFDGDPDEALIEFVRRNVYHGLPLTLRERKRAASQVLLARQEWSDRRIAEICALSPKTVGRLRLSVPDCQSEENPHLDTRTRVGRDNKSRPVNSASVRARVIEAIEEQPDASLRSVAAAAGVSPETVRIVRMNMSRPAVAEAAALPAPPTPAEAVAVPAPRAEEPPGPGLTLALGTEEENFGAWFDRTSVSEDDRWRCADMVPLGRI